MSYLTVSLGLIIGMIILLVFSHKIPNREVCRYSRIFGSLLLVVGILGLILNRPL